jgi:hypothetical protein
MQSIEDEDSESIFSYRHNNSSSNNNKYSVLTQGLEHPSFLLESDMKHADAIFSAAATVETIEKELSKSGNNNSNSNSNKRQREEEHRGVAEAHTGIGGHEDEGDLPAYKRLAKGMKVKALYAADGRHYDATVKTVVHRGFMNCKVDLVYDGFEGVETLSWRDVEIVQSDAAGTSSAIGTEVTAYSSSSSSSSLSTAAAAAAAVATFPSPPPVPQIDFTNMSVINQNLLKREKNLWKTATR